MEVYSYSIISLPVQNIYDVQADRHLQSDV